MSNVDISPEAVERLADTFDKKAARHSGGTVAQGFDTNCADILRAQAARIAELEAENAILRTEKHADAEAIADLTVAPQEEGSLDDRMKAAGMIPLSDLLKSNGAMEKWDRHAGMQSFTDFVNWVHRKQEQYMTMRMQYELGDKDKSDDLFQWVFAHAGAFNSVATQLRAISEGTQ